MVSGGPWSVAGYGAAGRGVVAGLRGRRVPGLGARGFQLAHYDAG
jgi:hypothetical protein